MDDNKRLELAEDQLEQVAGGKGPLQVVVLTKLYKCTCLACGNTERLLKAITNCRACGSQNIKIEEI